MATHCIVGADARGLRRILDRDRLRRRGAAARRHRVPRRRRGRPRRVRAAGHAVGARAGRRRRARRPRPARDAAVIRRRGAARRRAPTVPRPPATATARPTTRRRACTAATGPTRGSPSPSRRRRVGDAANVAARPGARTTSRAPASRPAPRRTTASTTPSARGRRAARRSSRRRSSRRVASRPCPAFTNRDLVLDEHIAARGFVVAWDHPDVGGSGSRASRSTSPAHRSASARHRRWAPTTATSCASSVAPTPRSTPSRRRASSPTSRRRSDGCGMVVANAHSSRVGKGRRQAGRQHAEIGGHADRHPARRSRRILERGQVQVEGPPRRERLGRTEHGARNGPAAAAAAMPCHGFGSP